MIMTKLFDHDDGLTYTLTFSSEDAMAIISAPTGQTIKLPSIGGNILIKSNKAAIMYKNGSSGLGSIFSDYSNLCSQLRNGLTENE